MTGEELGIKLLRMLAAAHRGKHPNDGINTAEIAELSGRLSKSEYADFYYMTQIGNLISNLEKQAKSYNFEFFRWFVVIKCSLEEILRVEKTLQLNKDKQIDDHLLLSYSNFYNEQGYIKDINANYALAHRAVRGLMAVNSLISILMKAYHLPFMKCYLFDMTELQGKIDYFNDLVDEFSVFATKQNKINCFTKIDLDAWNLDKDMLKLTEKVAVLSHLNSLILVWCSNYEVILNNLMDFELFDNPEWIQSYCRPDGTKYGSLKYPERDGLNKWKDVGEENA